MAKYKYGKYKYSVFVLGIENYNTTIDSSVRETTKIYMLNLNTFELSYSQVNASRTKDGDFFSVHFTGIDINKFNNNDYSPIETWQKIGSSYYKIIQSNGSMLQTKKGDFSRGKGSFIEEVIADDGTFPNDGLHSDGFYYVKGALATIPINVLVNGTFVDSEKAYVNVNGVWKEVLEFHQVQNNQWVKLI